MFSLSTLRPALFAAGALILAGGMPDASAQVANDVICKGCVDSKDIKNGSITTKDIKNGTISHRDMKPGAVTPSRLAPAAKPAGVDYTDNGVSTVFSPVPATETPGLTVELTAPGPGHVVLTVSGYIRFDAAGVDFSCYLARGTTLTGGEPRIRFNGTNVGDASRFPFSSTRAFAEPAGGTLTYSFICLNGTGDASIFDGDLIALFVPAQY